MPIPPPDLKELDEHDLVLARAILTQLAHGSVEGLHLLGVAQLFDRILQAALVSRAPQQDKSPDHCCGASGFGQDVSDTCPACEYWRERCVCGFDRAMHNPGSSRVGQCASFQRVSRAPQQEQD